MLHKNWLFSRVVRVKMVVFLKTDRHRKTKLVLGALFAVVCL